MNTNTQTTQATQNNSFNFTGWEYLLIDAATQFGLDKEPFEKRIDWTMTHLNDLAAMKDEADDPELFAKAAQAISKARRQQPHGHLTGLDASCSGMQIMSAMTGCYAGAQATGLIDTDRPADAYTLMTDTMNSFLDDNKVTISRADAKDATMKAFYGSAAVPRDLFGEKTPQLAAFYRAGRTVAPGAWELLQMLLGSWKPWALGHSWQLPDGFEARVKVMTARKTRIEVDELDHATFTYIYYENGGEEAGLSNAANIVHSVDAWVVRSMHRRCNYDKAMISHAHALVSAELDLRHGPEGVMQIPVDASAKDKGQPNIKAIAYYLQQYQRSGMADIVIAPYLHQGNMAYLGTGLLTRLKTIMEGMLRYEPFALVTIHDEFKAHANNMNHVRWQYRELLAELADADLMGDVLTQIHGEPGEAVRLSNDLGEHIRKSAYAIC